MPLFVYLDNSFKLKKNLRGACYKDFIAKNEKALADARSLIGHSMTLKTS